LAPFAADQLPQQIQEAVVQQHCGPKLVGHISRNATALPVPERPAPAAILTAGLVPPCRESPQSSGYESLTPAANFSKKAKKMVRATDAKEVGVGGPR
jgi:hypothetical protein